MLPLFFMITCVSAVFDLTWKDYINQFPNVELNSKSEFYFIENIKYIIEHNQKDYGFKLGVTPFLHMSYEEWKNRFFNITIERSGEQFITLTLKSTPDSWSWVSEGVTTIVKDQGHAGTCYQHAATETIETAWMIKSNNLLTLSIQQGSDCSKLNHGVNGGLPDNSYKYATKTQQCLESDYPYTSGTTGKDGTCHFCNGAIPLLKSYVDVKDGDEKAMMQALLINSLSVGIKADDKQFQMYSSGILDYDCDNSEKAIDHAVVIEGYGTENGKDYWLVRNSWGTSWGDKGYIKMIRDKCMCGICHMASYPVF